MGALAPFLFMESIFKQAEFVKSITDVRQKPAELLPEIAFAGRSNVGKSSLLNAILNRKKLVKTSSTPGKTQLINYFEIDKKYFFVDLPGYGYARTPKKISAAWQKMLENYILKSKELKLVCLLVDARHSLQASDLQMSDWLNFNNIPYLVVLTKADKLSRNNLARQKKTFADHFPDHHIIPFSVSSTVYKKEFIALLSGLIS